MDSYEFETKDGNESISVEMDRFVLMDLPLEGTRLVLNRDGKKFYRKKPSIGGNIEVAFEAGHDQFPMVSKSLPQWMPGCEHNDKGEVIINSRREQMEICKRAEEHTGTKFTREYHHDDRPPTRDLPVWQ